MRASDTWVCVADGARAQFFRCDGPSQDLEPVMGFGLPTNCSPFAGRLAGQLDRAARDRLFEHLVLVGPIAVLTDVEGRMDPATRDMVVGEIDKTFHHATPRELCAHIAAWLPH
jgi:protein required for attachment to host cells